MPGRKTGFQCCGGIFAEFSAEEKDAVSHRGNALKKLKELLPTV